MADFRIDKAEIGAGLREIASRGERRAFLDTLPEKSAALGYLRQIKRRCPVGSDEYEFLQESIDKLFSPEGSEITPNYIEVNHQDFGGDSLFSTVSYLVNAAEGLREIAGRSGRPHAIDSEPERLEAIGYLQSVRKMLRPCETGVLDKSVPMLASSDPLQVRPFFPERIEDIARKRSNIFARMEEGLLGDISDPLFIPLEKGAYLIYSSGERRCMKGARTADSECLNIKITQTEIGEDGWKEKISPLRDASTPEEERNRLLDILRFFTPQKEDCVVQRHTAAEILWLVSASIHLKFHGFDLTTGSEVTNNSFRHFAPAVHEKGRLENAWVIDTWAGVILPESKWKVARFGSAY